MTDSHFLKLFVFILVFSLNLDSPMPGFRSNFGVVSIGYSDFDALLSGLLRKTPMAFLRIAASESGQQPNAPYGDGLVQDSHLFPRLIETIIAHPIAGFNGKGSQM
jgi:hypothetical protein